LLFFEFSTIVCASYVNFAEAKDIQLITEDKQLTKKKQINVSTINGSNALTNHPLEKCEALKIAHFDAQL
jgi:hypothetical protein